MALRAEQRSWPEEREDMKTAVWCGLVLVGLASAMTQSAAAEIITLKLAHTYVPGSIWYDVAEDYAARVRDRSGGSVNVEIAVPGSTDGAPPSAQDLLAGKLDVVMQPLGALARYDALAGIEAFPYLIRNVAHFKAVYDGPVGRDLLDQIGKRTAFHSVGAGYRGTHHLSSNRLVEKLDDLRGLKIRVPELKLSQLTWEYLGATAVPMDAAELFGALRQGNVAAQESPLEVMRDTNLSVVQEYVIETGHVLGVMTFILSDARYWALSEEVRALLLEEGEAAMRTGADRMIEMEARYRKDLETRGMTFIPVNRNAFQAKLAPMVQDFPELREWVKRIQDEKEGQ